MLKYIKNIQEYMRDKSKVLVIGLDSVPPELLFQQFKNELPNLKKLIEHGIYAAMHTCNPPITIPAWMVMMTSKTPGHLGLYGFRHRKRFSYIDFWIANSYSINDKTVWDIVGENNGKVCIVGVPPTYPPKKVNGYLISCFITPGADKEFTYPPELKEEIQKLVGEYVFDVVFRTEERGEVLKSIYDMTEKRFEVMRHLLQKDDWKFAMIMEIGIDRLHHAFWKFHDKQHPKYEPNNKYENVVKDYYKYIDKKVGELLSLIDENTYVLIVSDHGTKGMKGAFCVNEWLMEKGYLVLNEYPNGQTDLEKAKIDWSKTKSWGWGGYYSRVFINVKGREEKGVVEPSEYERFRDKLAEELLEIRDPNGRKMNTKVFKPEKLYPVTNGDKPDLMVYFDNLYWRSAGTIGHKTLYLSENDKGPDDSVHSMYGVFILYNPKMKVGKDVGVVSIYDVAPTLLYLLNEKIPEGMVGNVINEVNTWKNSF
jgi:predicted AlkP superfamily phosphohydrolase/phosphomutase